MRDVAAEVSGWLAAGQRVALATVISTWGSAPRPTGSRMAVSESGDFAGGVSGGCVDGDVRRRAREILEGSPAELLHYGVSDDLAREVGLSCGGEIQILIEPLGQPHRRLLTALEADEPAVLMSSLEEPLGALRLLQADDEETGRWLKSERPERVDQMLIEPFPRAPELLIVGASHVGVALCRMAPALGFRVTVIEPRKAFSGTERLAGAERVLTAWPDEAMQQVRIDQSTYVAVLSHDARFEDPAIIAALRAGPRYLGAIGSRATHQKRLGRLRAAGLSEKQLGSIHAPIGLDIGARTAEEVALAILAEMVAVRSGRPGVSLTGSAPVPA